MKRVVGISLGSSERDHSATIDIMGTSCQVERIGTDGDMDRMIAIIKDLDGEVDAFGLGGIDRYVHAVDCRYEFRDARRIVQAAQKTPIVDGSGLKNTLERRVIEYLAEHTDLFKEPKRALLICAMDRLGLAQALEKAGCIMTYGDVLFVLNLPFPLVSLNVLAVWARLLVPLLSRLPFRLVYPTGERQTENKPRHVRYFMENDIIAGDFHFIRRFAPLSLPGKVIITNTVTPADIEDLRNRQVKTLITTTPEMGGRSFGTNIMEALLVCLSGRGTELTEQEYNRMLLELNLTPRIIHF
ncbi:MAG TPA: quinate 5-dehydrogenase [Firmicutes bacterium]|nr:quinate 5-dehydrogenase [Bacillota bacterium]